MSPTDPLTQMLGGFQERLAALQQEAAQLEVEATSGGGLVTATATGDGQLTRVRIDPSAVEDVELLEDLVLAAANEALRKGQAEGARKLQELTAGLPIPPGLLPGM